MSEPSPTMEKTDIRQFENVLSEAEPKFDPIEQAERVLDNAAFYDFSFYEFLFSTETGYHGGLSDRALATLDDFQVDAGGDMAALLLDVLVCTEQAVRDQIRRLKRRDWDEEQVVEDLHDDFYRSRASLPDVLRAYQTAIEEAIGPLFLEFVADLIARYLRGRLYQAYPHFYAFWSAWSAYFAQEHGLWHDAVTPRPVAEQAPTASAGEGKKPGQVRIEDDKAYEESEREHADNERAQQK